MKAYDLFCKSCGAKFLARRPDKLYCSFRCQSRAGRIRRLEQGDLLTVGRSCSLCGKHFPITAPSTNRRYCSEDCARKAAREQRRLYHHKNPHASRDYRREKIREGKWSESTVAKRIRRHYSLPDACQSCGESRITEIAHRPEYRRRGSWRKIENSQPHMVWILCPTCHKLLDRGICTAEELGLA